ncbi:MAG: hypothetical protein V5A52_06325 [Halovenus sp.]
MSRDQVDDESTGQIEVVQHRRGTFADFDGYDGDEETDATLKHDGWGIDS